MDTSHIAEELAQKAWTHIKGYFAISCNEAEESGGPAIILAAINNAVEPLQKENARLRELAEWIRKEAGIRGYYDLYEKIGSALAPQKEDK